MSQWLKVLTDSPVCLALITNTTQMSLIVCNTSSRASAISDCFPVALHPCVAQTYMQENHHTIIYMNKN